MPESSCFFESRVRGDCVFGPLWIFPESHGGEEGGGGEHLDLCAVPEGAGALDLLWVVAEVGEGDGAVVDVVDAAGVTSVDAGEGEAAEDRSLREPSGELLLDAEAVHEGEDAGVFTDAGGEQVVGFAGLALGLPEAGEREVAARVPETREEAAEPEMPDIGKASPADYQKAEVAKIMKPPDRVAKSTPGDERVKNRRPYKGHLGTYSTTRMLLFVWAEMKESYPELNDLTKLVEEINIDERGTLFRLYANGTFAQIRNLCTKIKRQDKYCLLTRI